MSLYPDEDDNGGIGAYWPLEQATVAWDRRDHSGRAGTFHRVEDFFLISCRAYILGRLHSQQYGKGGKAGENVGKWFLGEVD